jgi:hypothetical protein
LVRRKDNQTENPGAGDMAQEVERLPSKCKTLKKERKGRGNGRRKERVEKGRVGKSRGGEGKGKRKKRKKEARKFEVKLEAGRW